MDEQDVRAIVREVLTRRTRNLEPGTSNAEPGTWNPEPGTRNAAGHPSHGRYLLPPSDGPCLIEPGVACNHCGYCESHGH